jgi:hypothetical protein
MKIKIEALRDDAVIRRSDFVLSQKFLDLGNK